MHGTYHRLYSLNEPLLETAEVPLELLKAIQTGRKPDMELLRSTFPYQPTTWLLRAKINPAFKMPDSFNNIGSTGAGLTFFMLEPTETFEINPLFLVFSKPFFIQGNMNTSFYFKPLSLHIQVFYLFEGLLPVQGKNGLEAGISTRIPLSYKQQSLSLNYSTSTYWLASYRTQSPSYYTALYCCTIITQQGELIYRNMYSTQIAKTPFLAKIPQGIGFAAAAVHTYNIQKNNHSAVLQM